MSMHTEHIVINFAFIWWIYSDIVFYSLEMELWCPLMTYLHRPLMNSVGRVKDEAEAVGVGVDVVEAGEEATVSMYVWIE